MKMKWHHMAFDEATQIGFGEYTFGLNKQYHGVVVVRVPDGRIANWRDSHRKHSAQAWGLN
jgi:hypothetical protein